MTRQKHVYATTEIAHLWANQSQTDARNQQGNLYFEGRTLYSYRNSWRVGVLLTNDKGVHAVAINTVPIAHARKLYGLIKTVKNQGVPWEANGNTFHIGNYTVNRIDATGNLHAGCHFIHWAEIERIGETL